MNADDIGAASRRRAAAAVAEVRRELFTMVTVVLLEVLSQLNAQPSNKSR
jgi:hypothetical protein